MWYLWLLLLLLLLLLLKISSCGSVEYSNEIAGTPVVATRPLHSAPEIRLIPATLQATIVCGVVCSLPGLNRFPQQR